MTNEIELDPTDAPYSYNPANDDYYCEATHPDATYDGCYGPPNHDGRHHGYYREDHPYKVKGWADELEWPDGAPTNVTAPAFIKQPEAADDNFTATHLTEDDAAYSERTLSIANENLHPAFFSTRELAELYTILDSNHDIPAVFLDRVGAALKEAL